jgi:hypothetical protein
MSNNGIASTDGSRRRLLALLWALGAAAVSANLGATGALGEIRVNSTHAYSIDASTAISVDGVPIDAAQLVALGTGFNAQVNASNAGPGASGGTASRIALRNLLKGPVTSLDPLSVLNQPISTNADTVMRDVPGNDLANIALGDNLEISGYFDANQSVVAARVHLRAGGLDGWKLSGLVSGLSGEQFQIGTQVVSFAGVTPLACIPAFQDGQFVEIEALANATYTPASTLSLVTSIQCEDVNLTAPPGTTLVSVEGIVSAIPDPLPDPAAFSMLGIEVMATAQTEYRGGAADDLDAGVRLEVTGFYDATLATILAQEVRFVQAQVRFEAPVAVADVVAGESITIMGNAATFTAQTRDQDGIAANGLTQPTQVQVRGLIDSAGQISVTRVRDRGNPDPTDLRLRGPITSASAPNLLLLGITVDTGNAVFRDASNVLITSDAFFAQALPGVIVETETETASYNPATQTFAPTQVKLVDAGLPPAPARAHGNGAAAISRGTVTLLGSDMIFGAGFE